MRFGSAKLPNSRERVNALPTICTDSAYFGSEGSAWRFCLLVLAGLETRPSTNLSSPASATSRAHSSSVSRFLILSSMRPRTIYERPASMPLWASVAAMTERIASRSSGESRGLQMSQIRMIRVSSLSFHASCSIVSSNTQASPIRHSRVSPPTRKPHPAGSTSGRWTTRRKFAMPVCGGIRVFGFSTENMAVGERRSTSACGRRLTAAIVAGARAQRSSIARPFS